MRELSKEDFDFDFDFDFEIDFFFFLSDSAGWLLLFPVVGSEPLHILHSPRPRGN
jgi:hypothetical protein